MQLPLTTRKALKFCLLFIFSLLVMYIGLCCPLLAAHIKDHQQHCLMGIDLTVKCESLDPIYTT